MRKVCGRYDVADSQRFWRKNARTFRLFAFLPHQCGLLVGILVPIPRCHLLKIPHKLVPVHLQNAPRDLFPITFSTFGSLCINLESYFVDAVAVSLSFEILNSNNGTTYPTNTQWTEESPVSITCSSCFFCRALFLCTRVERFCFQHGFPVSTSASRCIVLWFITYVWINKE